MLLELELFKSCLLELSTSLAALASEVGIFSWEDAP